MRGGRVVVEGHPTGPIDLGSVLDIPVTIAGLSRENLANALAAASAGLAAGLPAEAVAAGLRSFLPDASSSPGRMNIWSAPTSDGGSATVILDFAHNEAGAEALLRVGTGLRRPGAALHASIGNAGDRTDQGIVEVGRLAGEAADTVQLAAKPHYLRGRTQEEIDALQRAGIRAAGKEPFEEVADEPTGLQALLAPLARRGRHRDDDPPGPIGVRGPARPCRRNRRRSGHDSRQGAVGRGRPGLTGVGSRPYSCIAEWPRASSSV